MLDWQKRERLTKAKSNWYWRCPIAYHRHNDSAKFFWAVCSPFPASSFRDCCTIRRRIGIGNSDCRSVVSDIDAPSSCLECLRSRNSSDWTCSDLKNIQLKLKEDFDEFERLIATFANNNILTSIKNIYLWNDLFRLCPMFLLHFTWKQLRSLMKHVS